MTTTASSIHHISDLEGRKDKTTLTALGPFFRKQERQSTSSSNTSSRTHSQSDAGSRVTLQTATSSLSGDNESDKQASCGDKSSNLSDSRGTIEEEGCDSRHWEKKAHATTATLDDDLEQPYRYVHGHGEQQVKQQVEVDTHGGNWENMFDGMSSLMASAGMENPLAGVGAAMETSSSYRSQPPIPEEEVEEMKDDYDGSRAIEAVPMTKNDMGTSKQEEEAMRRFDLLKDLVMLGGAEMYDDICPPTPQPLDDDETSYRKGHHAKDIGKKNFPKEIEFIGCSRRTKKTQLCAIVALILLIVLIIPIYMTNDANQKAAAGLAPATPTPTATPTTSTPNPTRSMSPSVSPSASQMPSNVPTDAPSWTPTMSNRPTGTPSLRPTSSNVPSDTPSISQIPSLSPSNPPSTSMEPSVLPSEEPSYEPSSSMMPSYSTISPDYSFKVRLQWEQSYFWQEEKVERWWCLECVRCTSYGGGDGNEHGCKSYSTGDEGACQRGDSIWIRDCRERGNRFNVLVNRNTGFMLRIATTDLCVTRERRRWLKVDWCDRLRMDQQFVQWKDYNKFELRPLEQRDLGEREADCISQLHHPKQDELVSLHNCRLCRIYETRYWQVYLG